MSKETETGKKEKYERVWAFYQKPNGKMLMFNKKEITFQTDKKILKRKIPSINTKPK